MARVDFLRFRRIFLTSGILLSSQFYPVHLRRTPAVREKDCQGYVMESSVPKSKENQVVLQPVTHDNWRGVAKLEVAESQRKFVAEPSYYLALCSYGGLWQPLAIYLSKQVIGFMMWALDTDDGSCWLGGILIDQKYQRRGYGRQAIQAAIKLLSEGHGFQNFALSYSPDNTAKHLYHKLGFKETGEWEDDEVIARLSLDR
jgi:diamine N-acetyltransferase